MRIDKNERKETGYRAVLDTNVLLSIFYRGNEVFSKIFEDAVSHHYRLVTSHDIIKEFSEKSLIKFEAEEEEIQRNIRRICHAAIVVIPKDAPFVVQRDPKDNPILACAIEGKAQFIVTGDKDLLSIGEYGGIIIEKPVDFWRTLGGGDW